MGGTAEKIMSGILRNGLLLVLIVALGGCQSLQERKMQKILDHTLRQYEATVRWGYLEQTYDFLQPELAENAIIPKNLGEIRVTGYERVRAATKVDENSATQIVAIRYVFVDRQIEKELIDRQMWEWDEETEKWSRSNSIPDFK
jgi:hypothetical protein